MYMFAVIKKIFHHFPSQSFDLFHCSGGHLWSLINIKKKLKIRKVFQPSFLSSAFRNYFKNILPLDFICCSIGSRCCVADISDHSNQIHFDVNVSAGRYKMVSRLKLANCVDTLIADWVLKSEEVMTWLNKEDEWFVFQKPHTQAWNSLAPFINLVRKISYF